MSTEKSVHEFDGKYTIKQKRLCYRKCIQTCRNTNTSYVHPNPRNTNSWATGRDVQNSLDTDVQITPKITINVCPIIVM